MSESERNRGFVGLTGSPEEAEERIAQWARGFEEKAQRYQEVAQDTEQIRLTESSSDGRVKVTVGPDGSMTDLEFSEKIRSMQLRELSSLILDTMRRAQSGIAGRVGEVMTAHLGDEDERTRAMMLDTLRGRFPEEVPEPESQQPSAKWDFEQEGSGEQTGPGESPNPGTGSETGPGGTPKTDPGTAPKAGPESGTPKPKPKRGGDDDLDDFGDDFDPLRD